MASEWAEARERAGHPEPILRAELYCSNQDCAVREVWIHVKEYDGPVNEAMVCPACRKPLSVHHVRTDAEQRDVDEREARCSVGAAALDRFKVGNRRCTQPGGEGSPGVPAASS